MCASCALLRPLTQPIVRCCQVWEMFPIDLETGARGDGMPLLKALSK